MYVDGVWQRVQIVLKKGSILGSDKPENEFTMVFEGAIIPRGFDAKAGGLGGNIHS